MKRTVDGYELTLDGCDGSEGTVTANRVQIECQPGIPPDSRCLKPSESRISLRVPLSKSGARRVVRSPCRSDTSFRSDRLTPRMTDKGESCFVCRSLSLLPAEFSTISLTAAITLRRAKACQKRRQEDYHRQRIREDTGYWQACLASA